MMTAYHRNVLTENGLELGRKIVVTTDLILYLKGYHKLTDETADLVMCKPTNTGRVSALLDTLKRKDVDTFGILVDALCETGQHEVAREYLDASRVNNWFLMKQQRDQAMAIMMPIMLPPPPDNSIIYDPVIKKINTMIPYLDTPEMKINGLLSMSSVTMCDAKVMPTKCSESSIYCYIESIQLNKPIVKLYEALKRDERELVVIEKDCKPEFDSVERLFNLITEADAVGLYMFEFKDLSHNLKTYIKHYYNQYYHEAPVERNNTIYLEIVLSHDHLDTLLGGNLRFIKVLLYLVSIQGKSTLYFLLERQMSPNKDPTRLSVKCYCVQLQLEHLDNAFKKLSVSPGLQKLIETAIRNSDIDYKTVTRAQITLPYNTGTEVARREDRCGKDSNREKESCSYDEDRYNY